MSIISPVDRVNWTLERQFPGWIAANRPALPPLENTTLRSGVSEAINNEYSEFSLATDWVLRPPGLKEFFEAFQKATVV